MANVVEPVVVLWRWKGPQQPNIFRKRRQESWNRSLLLEITLLRNLKGKISLPTIYYWNQENISYRIYSIGHIEHEIKNTIYWLMRINWQCRLFRLKLYDKRDNLKQCMCSTIPVALHMENIYFSWYNIPDMVVPIMISLTSWQECSCQRESYWTKGC